MDDSDERPILRPLPRRPFTLSRSSASDSPADIDSSNESHGSNITGVTSGQGSMSRNRSILNLTSSTLLGIYSPTAFSQSGDQSEPATPWGTGAETPARDSSVPGNHGLGLQGPNLNIPYEASRRLQAQRDALHAPRRPVPRRQASIPHRKQAHGIRWLFRTVGRVILLFAFGVVYGLIISQLHENRHIAPVRVEGINRASWQYLAFWGVAGIGLGSLLPWVDALWEWHESSDVENSQQSQVAEGEAEEGKTTDWSIVVRSIGAFVGIAFAI
ncbi:hypothetical protein LTS18_002194, partial [Coniosporium uncinatum]